MTDRILPPSDLPIEDVIPAPPGAGKTTRVPLTLLSESWTAGRKLILVEPRRIAARAAAERMAQTLGEKVGETTLSQVELNPALPNDTFTLAAPEGYDVQTKTLVNSEQK